MDKKIKRFYILPSVWSTVTNSQVFNWVEIVNKKSSIETDCISLTGRKIDITKVEKIEEKIQGKFYQRKTKRLIGHLYSFYVFLSFYFKSVKHYDIIIFQTRVTMLGWAFTALRFLPKVKVIFEARGAALEESKHVLGSQPTLNHRFRLFRLAVHEKNIVTKSDVVICVSNALEKYYKSKFKIRKNRFFVFPGAADTHLFSYKESLRKKNREKFDYKNTDKVIVYSGKLSLKWEIPDVVFSFFKRVKELDSNFKFLILTPDQDKCKEFVRNYDLINEIVITKVPFEEVSSYLNAADFGLLLREDVPMNNVASPTKFSEYIMSGLPTIVSNGVYDYVDLVNETGFGIVLENMYSLSKDELEKVNSLINIDRMKISDWGVANLSKDKFVNQYINLLQNI